MKELRRCLLVDDDIDDREIFLMALTEIDARVRCRTAGNGLEALHILGVENAECPDVIFLDVNMPRMNGLECLEEIRKHTKFDHCRIFIYTTIDDPNICETARQLDAGCLIKPPAIKELRQLLHNVWDGL